MDDFNLYSEYAGNTPADHPNSIFIEKETSYVQRITQV